MIRARNLRYAAFDPQTGYAIARGKRLGDVQGPGPRFLVDWKKERYVYEGPYPVARPPWTCVNFRDALDAFAESAKMARRRAEDAGILQE